MTWREVEAGIGRRAAWFAAGAVVLGVAAVATGLGPGSGPRTVAALIASWLFFAGASAGATAFRAFFRVVDARWARSLGVLGGAQAAFAPAAAVVLVVILAWAGRAPWVADASGWLATRNLVVRQVAVNAVLLGLAYFWFRPRADRREPPSRAKAVAYCIVYSAALSAWAFDFVLGPDPVWGSTLIGPYVFMGAFLAGTSAVTLLAVATGAIAEKERRDAGAFVFALAIFWAYLFWSQFLTMWYANIPDEIAFGLRRAVDGWGWVVLAVIGLVFVVPFVGLLHPAGRRSSSFLGAVAVAQLVGLWLNCHLLVVPSLSARGTPPFALRDVAIALGMLGAFALSVAPAVTEYSRSLAVRR
jgi:hypothetical protein